MSDQQPLDSLIEQRKAKLAALRAKGIDPFKNKFSPSESCKQAHDSYAEHRETAVAGRITAHREMGKSMFLDVRDQSGRIQIYAQKNVLGDDQWSIFTHLDLGDFIGVRGKMFTTKTGEISIKLESFVILAKALRPPPAKYYGLEDTEIRYRQRYLDLIANPEVKDVFLKRSEIIRELRNFLHSHGYIEVETPMMQSIPGGAAAQPFKTHHNALGCDFYMRIALELPLKRMLVGGVDKVFEIGRVFRNEGLSRKHNPEFTMLEAYQAYGDYESMMDLVQGMICHCAENVLDTLVVTHERTSEVSAALSRAIDSLLSYGEVAAQGRETVDKLFELQNQVRLKPASEVAKGATEILKASTLYAHAQNEISRNKPQDRVLPDFGEFPKMFIADVTRLENLSSPKTINLTPPWKRVKYKDLVREEVKKRTNGEIDDWFAISHERRQLVADTLLQYSVAAEDFELTSAIFEKYVEPELIQPTFVTHLPKELVPLAKLSPEDPTTVEVFECCINGQEIAPAYTEQNDPIEQRERLEHQAGGEQQKLDEDFLVALEHGMPPAGGMGMGIDRLCMMLLGQESIRDVVLFPQLKPK